MLDMEGAGSMTNIKSFCLKHSWPEWTPVHDLIQSNEGEGENQKVAVFTGKGNTCLVYFPDSSSTSLDLAHYFSEAEEINLQWYNTAADSYSQINKAAAIDGKLKASPPENWPDAILILKGK